MNILQQEDIIKGLPDQALQEEAKKPSGQVPQFLVVSEIQRRTDMRKKYQDPNQQQPQGTIADQITQEGIASVQPQQPMQGEQQQGQPMPMRGGGMTPFMRKYAGGGVVRMQEGGITPHEMAQMDAQMMAQKYPFLSGSRDEILQGLSTVDPNDVSYISSMFNGAPEIEAVLASRSQMPQPPMPIENVTEPSLLTLDGVNTLTPDGRRPNPNTPSVDTLEQFSNAFKEDAARAENLLATLDDSTAKEKEAISNPVNVNLPKIRTLGEIGEQAPQMLPLASKDNPLRPRDKSLSGFLASDDFKVPEKKGAEIGQLPSGLTDSLTAGNFGSPYEVGQTIGASGQQFMDVANVPIKGLYNATADATGGLRNLFSGIFGGEESNSDDEFRYNAMSKFQDPKDNIGEVNALDQARLEKTLALADRQKNQTGFETVSQVTPEVTSEVTLNDTSVVSDGAGTQGSGDPIAKGSNKAVSLLDRALGLNLDGAKKEAYAMAMIQLGAGIAKGDLAEGLSNAGVAASGVLDKARDRSGKQLDRDLQSQYYSDKLESSSEEKRQALTLKVETAYMTWLNEGGNLKTDAEKATYKSDLYKAVFGEEAQGDDDQSGQRGKVATISYDKDGNRI